MLMTLSQHKANATGGGGDVKSTVPDMFAHNIIIYVGCVI